MVKKSIRYFSYCCTFCSCYIIHNNDLGGVSFGIDNSGNYGYKKEGADTVYPFKSGGTYYFSEINENVSEINCNFCPDIVVISYGIPNKYPICLIINFRDQIASNIWGNCVNGNCSYSVKYDNIIKLINVSQTSTGFTCTSTYINTVWCIKL